ncbi:MAG: hypothetical protein V3U95_04195 [Dehalococcoidia bacterium]
MSTIQRELLKTGATNSVGVEASTAFIDVAKEEAQRQGHADRVRHAHDNSWGSGHRELPQ